MDDQKNETASLNNKPPFFKSWNQIYAFVLAVFAILVVLFYVFTVQFS